MLPPQNTHSPIAQLLSKHLVSSMSQSELSYYPYHQVLHSTPGLKHYMSALRQGKLVSPPRNTHRPIVQLLSKHLVSSMSQIILIPCQQVLLHSTPGLKDYMSALRQGKLVLPPRNTHRPIVQLLSKHSSFLLCPRASSQYNPYTISTSTQSLNLRRSSSTETHSVCPASRKACVPPPRHNHRPTTQQTLFVSSMCQSSYWRLSA